MDWLERRMGKVREGIRSLSLKRAVGCYIFLAALGILLAYLVTLSILNGWGRLLEARYFDRGQMESYRVFETGSGIFYMEYQVPQNSAGEFLQRLRYWLLPAYSLAGVAIASILFYNRRLKEPLESLRKEAEYISRGDLGYECVHHRGDELGELCGLFDEMRLQLAEDYRKTRNLMERQRQLNAAFAHDLRTPLTVLRGYTDYLSRYYPEGRVSEEQLCQNLKIMNQQVLRLMNFSSTMKEIHTLEDLQARPRETSLAQLEQNIRDVVEILDGKEGICVTFQRDIEGGRSWSVDMQIVMEVLENALSNALRYAGSAVRVILDESEDGRYLILYIQDDGPGFTAEGLKMARNPYYHDKQEKEEEHFGIGLFLCSLFCEKHGGELELSNSIRGGAIVTASFLCCKTEGVRNF